MSITQEETENLRRREIACESQGGEGWGILGTAWRSREAECTALSPRSPIESTQCSPFRRCLGKVRSGMFSVITS